VRDLEMSMRLDEASSRRESHAGAPSRAMNVIAKVVAVLGGAVLAVSALALSLVFFAVVLMIGVLVGGYLWWKTRELRKQIRTQLSSGETLQGEIIEGEIIEGEIIVEDTPERDTRSGTSPRDLRLK
jgi:hypothetical protein